MSSPDFSFNNIKCWEGGADKLSAITAKLASEEVEAKSASVSMGAYTGSEPNLYALPGDQSTETATVHRLRNACKKISNLLKDKASQAHGDDRANMNISSQGYSARTASYESHSCSVRWKNLMKETLSILLPPSLYNLLTSRNIYNRDLSLDHLDPTETQAAFDSLKVGFEVLEHFQFFFNENHPRDCLQMADVAPLHDVSMHKYTYIVYMLLSYRSTSPLFVLVLVCSSLANSAKYAGTLSASCRLEKRIN